MKPLAALVQAEAVVLIFGAVGDRLFPDVPTWVLGAVAVALTASAVGTFLWSLRDEKMSGKQIAKAMRENDYRVEKIREAIKDLEHKPLGDGHKVARLPDGTNIVTMADGSLRLALPVYIEGTVGKTKVGGQAKPGR